VRPVDAIRRSPLYAIVDEATAARSGLDVAALAREYLAGGVRLLQLRAKTAGSAHVLDWATTIAAAARRHRATFVVNDRADLARLADADGVHVGQDDLPVEAARAIVGADRIVGVSTHTPGQIAAAAATSASYIAVGPVFGTVSKETGYEPVGLELVRLAVAHASGRPVVAIGGITLDRAPAVLEAGAAAVAVIGDLVSTGRPRERAAEWIRALARGR
jgi:thiamine-phosphate pyrophosphorylase